MISNELVKAVEVHELNSRSVVDERLARIHRKALIRPASTWIAVMEGQTRHRLRRAYQDVIHAPGIHAQALNLRMILQRLPQPGDDFLPQTQQIPAQSAQDLNRPVLESMDLLQLKPPRCDRS